MRALAPGGKGRAALVRNGLRLGRERHGRKAPFSLALVTEPNRTPDPAALVALLSPGAAVIYRAFGRPDAESVGRALRRASSARGVLLLVGNDERLAASLHADGLHLPERRSTELPRIRARRPSWLLTAAAHSGRALHRADQAGADAILLSAAFPSRSPSAGRALGPVRFSALVGQVGTPVLALGGVNGVTAPRLIGTGCAGIAAVDGWLS